MAEFRLKAKNERDIKDKPRVYFTCHPDDLDTYFERVCHDLFATQDCAIFYTEDMSEPLTEENLSLDLYRMNLVVAPVTLRLLTTDNRAMTVDLPYAMENGIPVLPLMMESGTLELYSRPDRFGERQFITPDSHESSEIAYEKKLKDYLAGVLTSDEDAKRVRAAFDAYIFLSYRKKDRILANELMRIIHKNPKYRDVAIWYDEFLSPGESFRDNISRALDVSKLFALLVTPNLLEVPNFVMDEEYPTARKDGKAILPIEMADTDRAELESKYDSIPECVSGKETETMYGRLADMLSGITTEENDDDPEHNYLIGLAYLRGIDVEVDRERGMELITRAAEAEHPEAMDRIYEIYQERGDFRETLKWAERLYEYNLKEHGAEHEQTVIAIMNIGYAYDYLGNRDSALTYAEKAYKAAEGAFGKRHRLTLYAMNNLGVSYLNVGRTEEAKEILEQAYGIRRDELGELHPDTLTVLANLAGVYMETEDERALETVEYVYEAMKRALGEDHHDTILALYNLSEVLSDKDEARSCELASMAYERAADVLGEGHPDTLLCMLSYGLALSNLGEGERAIPVFLRGRELSIGTLGIGHDTTRHFISYLADEYKYIGDLASAAKYYKEVYEVCLSLFGGEHEDTERYLSLYTYCR